jgi:hypothetical protein
MTTPFYKKALQLFAKTQTAQIQKGLAKYPEPFNPHNWTPEELLNHALEESVDLVHYLVGLKELLDAKDSEIKKYKDRCLDYEKKLNALALEGKYTNGLPGQMWNPLAHKQHDMNYDYVYSPSTGDPLSPYGPFITKVPKYFDPDDQ